ncbi:MAG: hypothetical protein LBO05_05980 [Deltaproteobacteria bacterium]|nr:hypothetical protein [Deltaproteobacteria bacterium]
MRQAGEAPDNRKKARGEILQRAGQMKTSDDDSSINIRPADSIMAKAQEDARQLSARLVDVAKRYDDFLASAADMTRLVANYINNIGED